MGDEGSVPATIIIREQDTKEGHSDPIYGTAIYECWRLLDGKATGVAVGKRIEKSIDFGFDALDRILSDVDDLSPYLAPRPDAPILLPAHLDLFCQTALASSIEPDVRLFLHGKERGIPEARVVWRADLTTDDSRRDWKETVALCPPVSGETLGVPLHRLRAWLAQEESVDEDTGDVEGAGSANVASATDGDVNKRYRSFLIWRGRDRSETCNDPWEIRPNDVVVVPAGYSISTVGQSAPAETLGVDGLDLWEPASTASGKPAALRLDRKVLEPWLSNPPLKNLINLAEDPARRENHYLQEAIEAVLEYKVDDENEVSRLPNWLRDLFNAVRDGRIEDHPAGGVVLFAKKSDSAGDIEFDLFADDDDLLSASGREIPLADHTASVERAVEGIASRCLPKDFLAPLLLAAHWHDVGKLDERFQLILRQGNEAANVSKPLAKSAFVPTSPARREAIRAAADLPKGFRHEMLSLQLVERYAQLRVGEQATDLILHLVASHHGHARPFAPIIPDLKPPAITERHGEVVIALDALERARLVEPHSLASCISERFWRLTRRYGWWGLAYLEAVLRLSDWYGSERIIEVSPSQQSAPPHLRAHIDIAARMSSDQALVLTGLDGGNPLGFLAALGALVVLRRKTCPQARLAWRRTATWQAILTDIALGPEALCDAITRELQGKLVSDDAEKRRMATQKEFDSARKALKDKRNEIKKRGLRGKDRTTAIEVEIYPLEQEVRQKRGTWLDALRNAIPSRELALGKHIDCTSEEYREHATSLVEDSIVADRGPLDLLAAFASDAYVEKSGRVVATPFCFITGSGHQFFLDTVRQLMSKVAAERVKSVLFEPWTYSDEKLSLRWDPVEDRRYALMDRDPTASDNKSRTVWMANLLAYRALALFPSAPGSRRLETVGWSGRGECFSWPLWGHAVDPDTIRSQMRLPDLAAEVPDRSALRARGIQALFRSERIKVGTGANFKINFGPARGM
jgi:CRISPR-associated endonuclease Cas3-HD